MEIKTLLERLTGNWAFHHSLMCLSINFKNVTSSNVYKFFCNICNFYNVLLPNVGVSYFSRCLKWWIGRPMFVINTMVCSNMWCTAHKWRHDWRWWSIDYKRVFWFKVDGIRLLRKQGLYVNNLYHQSQEPAFVHSKELCFPVSI